jgi:DNA polymerase III epsilon subunit-like protein
MTAPRCQVSVDLETLNTSPDAVILTIGAVASCEQTGERRKFYAVCNANAQPGRTVSQSTLKWWDGQSAEARTAFDLAHQPDAPLLSTALAQLTEWLGDLGKTHDVFVWGNGSDFDIAMLNHAYKQISDFVPWNFRRVRDMRTLYDLTLRFGLDIKNGTKRVGTHHNALNDAEFQADVIMESLRQLDLAAQFIRESDAFDAQQEPRA